MPKYMGANSCIESYSIKILKGTNLQAPTIDEVFRPYLMVQLFGEDTTISRDVSTLYNPIFYSLLLIFVSTSLLIAY